MAILARYSIVLISRLGEHSQIFYQLDFDTSQNYRDMCKFINLVSKHKIETFIDTSFTYSIGLKQLVVKIEATNKEKFEQLMAENNIKFKYLDLSEQYAEYCLRAFPKKEKLDDTFVDGTEDIIISLEIFPIIDGPNGKQLLTEETVTRKDRIKIYTHSDERCGHHMPHVHCAYGDDRNYCVISLCNLDVIQPLNYKSAKIKKIKEIISENINKCRLAWNKTSSILKFKIDGDGNPINELERV